MDGINLILHYKIRISCKNEVFLRVLIVLLFILIIFVMKTLNFEQMENLQGGDCDAFKKNQKALSIIGVVTCVASFTNPITALIVGPTSLGLAVGAVICAYQ